MRNLELITFLFMVILLLFGMSYYTLERVLSPFSVSLIWFWAIVIAIIYPFSAYIDHKFHNKATVYAYYITNVLLGFLFLLFSLVIVVHILSFIISFDLRKTSILVIIFTFLLTIYSMYNGSKITIKTIKQPFEKNLRLVQLTDIHVGTIKNSKLLHSLVQKTNKLKPDIVCITGDLVDGSGKLSKEIFLPLNNIKAPTYFVMGNHEFYEGEEEVEKLLSLTKIILLKDKVIKTKGLQIIGLDYSQDNTYVKKTLANLNYDKKIPTILLNHTPTGFEFARKNGINLQLAGHTHNGQIFPFNLIVRLFFPKIHGLYTWKEYTLYVSPGTSTWGPPMRLGSKNEITVFELGNAQK